jgi:hypothetical protein
MHGIEWPAIHAYGCGETLPFLLLRLCIMALCTQGLERTRPEDLRIIVMWHHMVRRMRHLHQPFRQAALAQDMFLALAF